jgi:hypothetical protein
VLQRHLPSRSLAPECAFTFTIIVAVGSNIVHAMRKLMMWCSLARAQLCSACKVVLCSS